MSEDGNPQEEQIVIDYEALDPETGFKAVELQIWKAFEDFLAKPEDERGEPEGFVEEYGDEQHIDKKRIKYVTTIGIYAGSRDEFNQRSGCGKAIYANGDVYDGEFFEGKKNGQGHYTFKSTPRAEVDVLMEKMWKAKAQDETREAFVARASKHLRIGASIVETALEYGFRSCYHGDYKNGLRVGEGLMRNRDGSVYKGQWKDNKRHGQGIFYFINGDVYSGHWDMGQKHGFGTYQFADGGEYRGEWVKGNFVEGQWIMSDGNYYEGLFDTKNRPFCNHASFHFPQRQIAVQGVFRKGKWAPLNEMTVSDEKPEEMTW
jgi:hypothetical protein